MLDGSGKVYQNGDFVAGPAAAAFVGDPSRADGGSGGGLRGAGAGKAELCGTPERG